MALVILVSGLVTGSLLAVPLAVRGIASPLRLADVPSCNGAQWRSTHLLVRAGGCQATFGVIYAQSFDNWSASSSYNFSFAIPWLAELTAAGQVVRFAGALAPVSGGANVTSSGGMVNLTQTETINVADASGTWDVNDSWFGAGPQWSLNNATVGTTTLTVVFHLAHAGNLSGNNGTFNGSSQVKFDVGIAGWPWASASDELGFGLDMLGAAGAHFNYTAATHTYTERWNSTNQTLASLELGGNATTLGTASGPQTARAADQAGLFFAGSPDREAVALVTFEGASGGYTSIGYDPVVAFNLGAVDGIGSGPPTLAARSPLGSEILALAAVTGVAALVVGTVGRARRRRTEARRLLEDMRRTIDSAPPRNSG
ncbi:MAG: hypothetical protein L3K17_05670 [Thermoplasmata archaeon]|nr:hypothetical protein [Thermoplasmata archaeon]